MIRLLIRTKNWSLFKESIQDLDHNLNKDRFKFWSSFLQKFLNFTRELKVENFRELGRGLVSKVWKKVFQKNLIFRTQYPMTKCLFLTPFFQLTFMNFGIGSFLNFDRRSILKSKSYFLGVWRKKIFHGIWVILEKLHIEFFILGLDGILKSFGLDFELNWFKSSQQILETTENWSLFKGIFEKNLFKGIFEKNLFKELRTKINNNFWSESIQFTF